MSRLLLILFVFGLTVTLAVSERWIYLPNEQVQVNCQVDADTKQAEWSLQDAARCVDYAGGLGGKWNKKRWQSIYNIHHLQN